MLDKHGLRDYFITAQFADLHPSKPHPSKPHPSKPHLSKLHPAKPHPAMLQAALAETGIAAKNAVVIGDTQFDMEMAGAASVHAIGVSWGYHELDRLVCADYFANDFVQIPSILATLWREAV